MQNLKCENEFDPDNEPVGETHFYMNCFTQTHFETEEKPTQK